MHANNLKNIIIKAQKFEFVKRPTEIFMRKIFLITLGFITTCLGLELPVDMHVASYHLCMRYLEPEDYQKGFLQLLEQLTTVNFGQIGAQRFSERVGMCAHTISSMVKAPVVVVIEDVECGQIVATATLFIEPKFIHNLGLVGHIEDVVVDEKLRGLGLGNTLINQLVQLAHAVCCYKVILDCSEYNVGFYTKCYFERKGVEMVHYF